MNVVRAVIVLVLSVIPVWIVAQRISAAPVAWQVAGPDRLVVQSQLTSTTVGRDPTTSANATGSRAARA